MRAFLCVECIAVQTYRVEERERAYVFLCFIFDKSFWHIWTNIMQRWNGIFFFPFICNSSSHEMLSDGIFWWFVNFLMIRKSRFFYCGMKDKDVGSWNWGEFERALRIIFDLTGGMQTNSWFMCIYLNITLSSEIVANPNFSQ